MTREERINCALAALPNEMSRQIFLKNLLKLGMMYGEVSVFWDDNEHAVELVTDDVSITIGPGDPKKKEQK